LAKNPTLKIRDKVYTIGAPKGSFPIETEGYISIPKMNIDGSIVDDKILLSLPITSGNSGSPLYNENGDVIGMIVMGDMSYPFISFALNVDYINKFIKDTLELLKDQENKK